MVRFLKKLFSSKPQGPWILASALVLGLLVTPFAVAAGDGGSVRGGARNPSSNQTQEYTSETQIIADNSTYGTRQSNKSNNGGGAIYGCRSGEGGTPKGNEPCIRANNLSQGRAFEFASNGPEVGHIDAADPKAAPFTTNATGVATGLNADKVDGKSASDIVADAQANNQFAAVGADGKLGATRGAASVAHTPDTGIYTVVFTNDISKCIATATESTATDAGAVAVEVKDSKTLTVVTRAGGDGATGTKPADRPFNLLVTC